MVRPLRRSSHALLCPPGMRIENETLRCTVYNNQFTLRCNRRNVGHQTSLRMELQRYTLQQKRISRRRDFSTSHRSVASYRPQPGCGQNILTFLFSGGQIGFKLETSPSTTPLLSLRLPGAHSLTHNGPLSGRHIVCSSNPQLHPMRPYSMCAAKRGSVLASP